MMQQDRDFLEFLNDWSFNLPQLDWNELKGSPLVLGVVDMVKGFCSEGPLASPRIGRLVPIIQNYLSEAEKVGCSYVFYPCDAHQPDSPEFNSFPVHCLAGSTESQLVDPLQEVFVQGRDMRVDKKSLSSFVGTDLSHRLLKDFGHSDASFLIMGDCTDLCILHCVMGLVMLKNTYGCSWRILVAKEAVDTYDLPLATAHELKLMPHPGDLWHKLALYQMALNGVEVVAKIGLGG